jgi:hypothetical protein
MTEQEPIQHGNEPRPDTQSIVDSEIETEIEGERSPPPIGRRSLLLGAAAVAVAGIVGWRMMGGFSGGPGENRVEIVLDRDEIKRGLARAGLNTDPLLMIAADKDQLQLWRIAFLPRSDGDMSQVFLSTSLDHRGVNLGPASTTELVARRSEDAFGFNVIAAMPYEQTRGVWITKAGAQPYALLTGQRFTVKVF